MFSTEKNQFSGILILLLLADSYEVLAFTARFRFLPVNLCVSNRTGVRLETKTVSWPGCGQTSYNLCNIDIKYRNLNTVCAESKHSLWNRVFPYIDT